MNEVGDWKRRGMVSWLKKLNVALGTWIPSSSLKKVAPVAPYYLAILLLGF